MTDRERPGTAARGYGSKHQRIRRALLAVYNPSDPCPRCGEPLGGNPVLLDLGHVDGDRSRYNGLEHASCNRGAARAAARAASPAGPLVPIEPGSSDCTDVDGQLWWRGLQGPATPIAEAW
jgi:hypothetical protein